MARRRRQKNNIFGTFSRGNAPKSLKVRACGALQAPNYVFEISQIPTVQCFFFLPRRVDFSTRLRRLLRGRVDFLKKSTRLRRLLGGQELTRRRKFLVYIDSKTCCQMHFFNHKIMKMDAKSKKICLRRGSAKITQS